MSDLITKGYCNMRILFVLGAMLATNVAYAEDMSKFDVNKRKAVKHYQVTKCEGGGSSKCTVAEVTVFDKALSGKEYFTQCIFTEVGKKRFMTCDRNPTKPIEVVKLVEKVKVVEKKVIVKEVKEVVKNKNRISFQTGMAPVGVESKETEDNTTVTERRGLTFGVGYSRLLNDQISLGGSIHTNKAFNLSIGFDF